MDVRALPIADSVVVTVREPLSVDAGSDPVICKGQSVNLFALTAGGLATGYDFEWDQGAGNTQVVSVSPGDTTTYRVILKDFCTIDPDTDWVTVFVHPVLDLEVSDDTLVCAGSSVDLSAVGTGGRGINYTYSWDNGLGDGPLKTVAPDQTTSYTVTLSDGCTTTPAVRSVRVAVEDLPVPGFSVLPASACVGNPVTFSVLSVHPAGSGFLWNLGDGNSDTLAAPEHVYDNAGSYDVSLRVTSPLGCVGQSTLNGVVDIRNSPVADFDASPDTASIVAPRVAFENRSQGALSYLWDFGNGFSSIDTDPVHDYLDTGVYLVTLVATADFGCEDTVMRWVRINNEYLLHIPTAFSPNGDGHNDVFAPVNFGVDNVNLSIFNRWGERIYSHDGPNLWWDGITHGGSLAQEGVYVYILQVIDFTGRLHEYNGSLTVLY